MKKILIMAVFTALPMLSISASAGTGDEEKQLLIKSATELEYVLALIEQAEAKDNKKGNVSLDYSALKGDLVQIQEAITRHASRPKRTPRRIDPLTKAYSK